MDQLILAVVIVLVVVGFVIFEIVLPRKTQRAWRMFAKQAGLEFDGPPIPEIPFLESLPKSFLSFIFMSRCKVKGLNQGFPFILETIYLRKKRRTYTRMHLRVPELPKGIFISREGIKDKIMKKLGSQDIQTTDPEFDKSFLIKGNDPEEVRRYLTPDRRRAILKTFRKAGGLITLWDNGIYFEQKGVLRDVNKLMMYYNKIGEVSNFLKK